MSHPHRGRWFIKDYDVLPSLGRPEVVLLWKERDHVKPSNIFITAFLLPGSREFIWPFSMATT